jgi:hypothetical protein
MKINLLPSRKLLLAASYDPLPKLTPNLLLAEVIFDQGVVLARVVLW